MAMFFVIVIACSWFIRIFTFSATIKHEFQNQETAYGHDWEEAFIGKIQTENGFEKDLAAPVRVTPASMMKGNYHVDEFGRVTEVEDKYLPDEEIENSTSFNCKYHDPCAKRYHAKRTYYPAYRPSIFILCYKYDFCIELACPANYFWNITTEECKRSEEDYGAPSYEVEEEIFIEHIPKIPPYDMTPYDCKKKYPCTHDSFFSPKAVFRHVDPDKFIFCNFWACDIYACPKEMLWYQDVHRCLIPVDYESHKIMLGVTEELENNTQYLGTLRTGFYANESNEKYREVSESTESNYSGLSNDSLQEISTQKFVNKSVELNTSNKPEAKTKNPMTKTYKKHIKHKTYKTKISPGFMYLLKSELDKERSNLEMKLKKLQNSVGN